MTPTSLVNMIDAADLAALVEVVAASPSDEAKRGLARLIALAEAGRGLSATVGAMVTDLFGGSNPREVAHAARGALAVYSVTSQFGTGAELIRRMQDDPNPAT